MGPPSVWKDWDFCVAVRALKGSKRAWLDLKRITARFAFMMFEVGSRFHEDHP
tara:strand:+ start:247 stop:405 length:159 start_codon:yes stop_codon:yes gene_type:complete